MSGVSNWEFHNATQGTLPSFSANFSTPIAGTASARSSHAVGGRSTLNACVTVASGLTSGVTTGRLRTFIDIFGGPIGTYIGFSFMQSARNITTGSQSFYWAAIVLGFSGLDVYIGKVTTSNLHTALATIGPTNTLTETVLGQSLGSISPSFSSGTIPIEVRWDYDIINLLGTGIEFSVGTANNFGTLSPRLSVADTNSPISTSVAEGLISASSTNGLIVDFDTTSLFVP